MRREAGQGLVTNRVAPLGDMRHPEAGGLHGVGLGDFGQHGIEQVVIQGRRIQQPKGVGVGTDAAFQGQVHQQGAGQRAHQRPRRDGDETDLSVVD